MKTSTSSWLTQFLTKLKSFVFFLLTVAVVFTLAYVVNFLFEVKNVEVTGVSKNHKVLGLAAFEGGNLVLLSPHEVSAQLIKKNPSVRKVEVEKKYPSTLRIRIELYRPKVELAVNVGYFILAEDGRILEKSKTRSGSYTSFNYYQKLNYFTYGAGDFIEFKDIQDSIFFVKTLENMGFKVDVVDINNRDMLLCNIGEKKIIFTSEKDRALQQYEVGQILKQFKIEGKDFRSVDLRFEKPVVKF